MRRRYAVRALACSRSARRLRPSASRASWPPRRLSTGVRTSAHHSRGRIHDIQPTRVLRTLEEGKVPVVAGFQVVTEDYEVTTLGRGGSDTTAVALAVSYSTATTEIYTDVDGIYSAD